MDDICDSMPKPERKMATQNVVSRRKPFPDVIVRDSNRIPEIMHYANGMRRANPKINMMRSNA